MNGVPCVDIQHVIEQSKFFQQCLENLLALIHPSFYCPDFVIKILIHGPEGAGKRALCRAAAKKLGMTFIETRVSDLFDENIVGTEKKLRAIFTKIPESQPCLVNLSGYELFCDVEESDVERIAHAVNEELEEIMTAGNRKQPIVFTGSTCEFDRVFKTPLSHMFQHNIDIGPMSVEQAGEILALLGSSTEVEPCATELLKRQECGDLYLGKLLDLVVESELNFATKGATGNDPRTHEREDGTRWEDIGGLGEVKKIITDTIQLALDCPELRNSGLGMTGILLHGPPGTGKTLLARAVATECNLNFINIKGPEMLNEYVGESEDNIRKVFKTARDSSPSVIFFDEIDSLAPNRGQTGDAGGVMDRMVSQILAEMDSIGKSEDVFVIGATNRIDLVDPSLLRPGRFDKVVEVSLPTSKDNRVQILEALTRRLDLADDVDLNELEALAPPNMSGADFQGLCSRALQISLNRCIEQLETGDLLEDDAKPVITMKDFLESLKST